MLTRTLMPAPEEIRADHVENTIPPVWFQGEREQVFETASKLNGDNMRFGMVRKAEYDYLAELKPESLIELRTFISRLGKTSAVFKHEAWQRGQCCVVAHVVVLMMDSSRGIPHLIEQASRDYLEQKLN